MKEKIQKASELVINQRLDGQIVETQAWVCYQDQARAASGYSGVAKVSVQSATSSD